MAAISMATSDFQNFFEVATGPCENEVNLACGDFLSSLFSLLSFLCSLPSSLAAAQFSDPTSHLSLRTSHQAIHSASNPLDPVPHHPFALPSAHLSDRTSLSHPAGPGAQQTLSVSCCCSSSLFWVPCSWTYSSYSCLSLSRRFSLRSFLFFPRG